MRHHLACLFLTCFVAVNSASADLIVNGGFETPNVGGTSQFQTIGSGGEPSGFGWRVTTGNVDVVRQGTIFAFSAFEGLQFLDLDGTMPGGIAQSFATIQGNTFTLTFAYANNPQAAGGATVPAHGTVRVFDTTSNSDLISPLLLTHGSSTIAAPDWTLSGAISFVAKGNNTTLSFISNDPSGSGGIFLDGASVNGNTVPEPTGFSLIIFGLAFIARLKNKRSRLAGVELPCTPVGNPSKKVNFDVYYFTDF